MTEIRQNADGPRVIVACRVMEPELERARQRDGQVEIRYLDQGLHRTPQRMADQVQSHIDAAAPYASTIVLGYGLCSNGIVGVTARQQGLIVPRAHDCISLFFGSVVAYKKVFDARPGTYYLTPGWIAERKDPLGIMEEYIPKYGEETSKWVMDEELKHYTHIVLIDTGVRDLAPLRERAQENARVFGKMYEEVTGSPEYFEEIIRGPYTEEDFFFLKPGDQVTQELYLAEALACASS